MTRVLKKILCVDDDKDILAIASMALETIGGFNVMPCSSGEEALDVVDQFEPDFILLDCMMPNMDGPATLSALRKRASLNSTPIAFMTARVQPHEIDEYLKLGASAVMAKPFDPMTLADEIKFAWDAAYKPNSPQAEAS